MRLATTPADPDTHVFACVLAIRLAQGAEDLAAAVGLTRDALDLLLETVFGGLPADGALSEALRARSSPAAAQKPIAAAILEDEAASLRSLLLEHRCRDGHATDWMASVVARACLFPNHLWQDLGLFNRGELSALLFRHFEPLAARNSGDMKWKKFFYKQFCERSGLGLCPAPTCDECVDRPKCFGPEE